MSDETRRSGGPRRPEGWPAESAQRLEKAEALRALGVDPYPNRYERTHRLGEIVARARRADARGAGGAGAGRAHRRAA